MLLVNADNLDIMIAETR